MYESEIFVLNRQELIRRILIVAIMVLIVALVVLFASLILRGTCSSAANNGIMPTNEPSGSPIIDVNASTAPATETPATDDPVVTLQPATAIPLNPTDAPSAQPIVPGVVIPQSPYPSIPYCVTEGTFEDVKARLELLKKLPSGETIILLDVGHGGFDGGTVGITSGVTEADINLQVARKVAERLAAKGYFVFMTRMGDYAVGNSKDSDMKWRKQVMKLDIFDVSISIHQNALATDQSVRGARLYAYKNRPESEKLANSIITEYTKFSSYCKNHVYIDNLMVVREPICPSTLVECGFLSCPEEEALLRDPSYQDQIAIAVSTGVENFLNNR